MKQTSSIGNDLLDALPEPEWSRTRGFFQPVELVFGKVLLDAGERVSRLYFPTDGVISTVAVLEDGGEIETATTGREGMVDVAVIPGGEQAMARQVVQVPGSALVISMENFRRLRAETPPMNTILDGYVRRFLAQVMQSVACNAAHSVEMRCARWLLMCHDRVRGDVVRLTQEYLAVMLGVSRFAVSEVMRMLRRAGTIEYRRGAIHILDRPALEALACECYGIGSRRVERAILTCR